MSVVRTEIDGSIATVTIARPEKLNALDPTVLGELYAAFEKLASSDTPPRAVVFTGEGKAFVAGADIAAMKELSPVAAKGFADAGHRLGTLLESLPFPIIAAVNGFALGGGCELALACDFIYASEKAKFGQPEVKLGVIPGFGGTQRLARRVGLGRARELVYTGDMLTAEEALRIGLVNAVFPADQLIAKAVEAAKKIAAVGPLAVSAAKRVLLRGADESLPTANELEATAFAALFGSDDQREGMKAFVEKRNATFTGR
ncbi:MAG: crotonase [Polyangiaceae bacterium]|nr:crotonase [Polyangiaceae bacterium]